MSSPEMTNQPSQNPESNPTVSAESTTPNTEVAAKPVEGVQNENTEQRAAPPPARAPYVSREERDRRRREALASLVVGEWREGKVTGIAAFGAFVDLGGVDGLVHVSQLGTGGYVERVEDVVQVGQVVRVRVAEVESERGRVSLSMREARPTSAPPRTGDRPAPTTPRPPRPATGGAGAGFAPSWNSEPAPEQPRPDRRSRGGERNFGNKSEERPARRTERPRRSRDSDDEEWRTVRGDPRNYYSFGDEAEDEPAPTTAEELVARFGRKDSPR